MKLLLLLALIFVLANSTCEVGDGETVGQFSTMVPNPVAAACSNCLECGWDTTLSLAKCVVCNDGYYESTATGKPQACTACPTNVLTCATATTSIVCASGFIGDACDEACPVGFETCGTSAVANDNLWVISTGTTPTCKQGYGLVAFVVTVTAPVTRRILAEETWKTCRACFDSTNGTCSFSNTGTLTSASTTSVEIEGVAAAKAADTWVEAEFDCVEGYVYNDNDSAPACTACPIGFLTCSFVDPNYTCTGTSATCCITGYELIDSVCTACPVSCDSCTTTAGVVAHGDCALGYVKVTDVCTTCGVGASVCTQASSVFTISKCFPGYFLKAGATAADATCQPVEDEVCEDCAEGCSTCEDGEICTECIDGYDLGEDDTCEEEDDGGDGGDDSSSSSLLKPIIYLSMIFALILFY